MNFRRIQVECYSGCRTNERPVAFNLQEGRLKVAEILDHWYEGALAASRPETNYLS